METNNNYFLKEIGKKIWESFHTIKYNPLNEEHSDFVSMKMSNFFSYIIYVISYSEDIGIPFGKFILLMKNGIIKRTGWKDEEIYIEIIVNHLNNIKCQKDSQ